MEIEIGWKCMVALIAWAFALVCMFSNKIKDEKKKQKSIYDHTSEN